jgi:hypothetical protein
MSRIPLTHLWKLAKPYLIIGRIAVLVLGSLTYLHFVESFRNVSKASKALDEPDSEHSTWNKRDLIDLP